MPRSGFRRFGASGTSATRAANMMKRAPQVSICSPLRARGTTADSCWKHTTRCGRRYRAADARRLRSSIWKAGSRSTTANATRGRRCSTAATTPAPAAAGILLRTAGCWVITARSMNALAEAVRLSEELKHPLTTVIALWFAALVHYQRGDRAATKAAVERALTLAAEFAISGWSDTAILLPWANGARLSRRELAELHGQIPRVASTAWRRVFSRCTLVELYLAAGYFDEGLAV